MDHRPGVENPRRRIAQLALRDREGIHDHQAGDATPAAPEIPTIAEQGSPNYVVEAWFGVLGPKGMSAADVKRVHEALVAAFNDPAVKEAMVKQGNTISISTSEVAQNYFRSEKEKYAKLVKKAGIELQ